MPNYVLLEKITVGAAGASSVTFSGIPQTGYTDLVVKASVRTDGTGAPWLNLRFNGSSTNYSQRYIYGTGAAAASVTSGTSGYMTLAAAINSTSQTANTFTNAELYIPNYAGSNYKSVSTDTGQETNATTAYATLAAGLWSDTAAITQVAFFPETANFAQYSTFYLYGVAKLGTTPAIVPYATGGDTIMTDGTYWYHTFLSSGTFTPGKPITCDYLVVAGGGGSGGAYAGGGGGGGLRSTVTATGGGGSLETALSLGTSAYTVTVGAGGAGGAANLAGSQGSNSVFATITATGGGGGGGFNASSSEYNGKTGGSGGGGGNQNDGTTASGGSGTTNQGYAGGTGTYNSSGGGKRVAGGGGGAGAAGANGVPIGGTGGNGGNGVATSISGTSVTYAGGGGGAGEFVQGTGGTGGGGTNSAGTANTGGGGSMNYAADPGKAGGSGIVIVRYLV